MRAPLTDVQGSFSFASITAERGVSLRSLSSAICSLTVHTIRLRAAWRIDGEVAARRFNRPTGIDGETRVYLTWDGEPAEPRLNGEVLAATNRHDVTTKLLPSNELVLSGSDAATRESVRLEIEPG